MKHYLFTDKGEDFIVGANNLTEAFEIAIYNFGDGEELRFITRMTDEEAESSGLDEY